MNSKGEVFELFHDKLRIYATAGRGVMTPALAADQPKTVAFMAFLGQNTNPFTGKLPTIRHIALTTHPAFIAIKKIKFALLSQFFK
jgi:hypothetical protein